MNPIPFPPKNLMFMEENHQKMVAKGQALLKLASDRGYVRSNSTVIDIGCGYGRLAYALLDSGFSGIYIGMDILDKHIAWLAENLEPVLPTGSQFIHLDVSSSRFLCNPRRPDTLLPKLIPRPNPETLAQIDPTEAVDSASIIPAVNRFFPAAEVIYTGGVIYGVALNDVIANFGAEDLPLLHSLLALDEALALAGESHYAVAIGER